VPDSNDDVQLSGTSVNLAANATVRGLSLSGGASLNVAAAGDRVFRTTGLAIDGTSKLNLNDNDLILQSTPATRTDGLVVDDLAVVVTDLIKSGRNGGLWNGPGIISSSAAAEPHKLTGLAVAVNDKGSGALLYSSFDGEIVDANSILVKYTYNGDADLNGKIDADDYFLIDKGFASQLGGYRNGDFDQNGVVDADDYFLIDRAFAEQSTVLNQSTPTSLKSAKLQAKRHNRHHHHSVLR
jgi:hypothetical protein